MKGSKVSDFPAWVREVLGEAANIDVADSQFVGSGSFSSAYGDSSVLETYTPKIIPAKKDYVDEAEDIEDRLYRKLNI